MLLILSNKQLPYHTIHLYWYPPNFHNDNNNNNSNNNSNNNNNNVQYLYNSALYTEISIFYESHTPDVHTVSAPNNV